MLQVQNISFSYEEEVLSNLKFNLEKGKTLAIIGESGCGKSTLLKLIYGLYDVDAGTIFWNDKQILGPKFNLIPGMEFMKYLAQDFDLMPYITVAENVGKYLSNIYKDKKQERISELLEIVEMTEFANTKAKNLIGGQMQRVALAKALVLEPEVLLLDEPFSHIDNFRKNKLRRKLFSYLKQKNITTLFATHDSDDVLSFADEVIVLKDKKNIETGTPIAGGVALLVTFVMTMTKTMGGGDSKLITAYALWMGVLNIAWYLFVVTLIGAVLAIAGLAIRRLKPFKNARAASWIARLQSGEAVVAYGIPIMLGALYMFFHEGYASVDVLRAFVAPDE